MRNIISKAVFSMFFLILTIAFTSCTKKNLAGRVYKGVYDKSVAILSFEDDGCAVFEIEDEESESLEYTVKGKSFYGNCVSMPAKEFDGKFDDEALLWNWWGGHPIILYRTDVDIKKKSAKEKRWDSIEGKIYLGTYDGSVMSISFEKFGLAIITIDDDTEYHFYEYNPNIVKVCLKKEYSDEEGEIFNCFGDTLMGFYDGESICLKDLDSVMSPKGTDDDISAKNETSPENKSVRELSPPKENHTETYNTLVNYGFHTSEGTIESDYISISKSNYMALSGIHAVFLKDDGKNCFLERKFLSSPDGVERDNLDTPKTINITGCIKEILCAREDGILRYAFVLIECKESTKRNVLLQTIYGKNFLGDFVQGKIFSEVDKYYSLEEKSSEIMNAAKNSNDFYYSDNLKWFIEK